MTDGRLDAVARSTVEPFNLNHIPAAAEFSVMQNSVKYIKTDQVFGNTVLNGSSGTER